MKRENKKTSLRHDKWMTVKDVADYLQMSTETIYRLAQRGEIPASKGASQWRFSKLEIDRWMKLHKNNKRNETS